MDTYQEQIEQLRSHISLLESRIERLEMQKHPDTQATAPATNVQTATSQPTPPPAYEPKPIRTTIDADTFGRAEEQPRRQATQASTGRSAYSPSHDGTMEKRIGKKVMSILAALLVFASLVYFGSIIQEDLNDTAKMCIMYAISGIVAVVGLLNIKKVSKYHILYTSFAACGLGAIYITSFIAHFALHQMSETALLTVIAIWIAVLVVLSRRLSSVFSIICYAGIITASVLSVFKWTGSPAGIILFVLSTGALYGVNASRRTTQGWWILISFPIVCLILMLCNDSDDNIHIYLTAAATLTALVWQAYFYPVSNETPKLLLADGIITFFVLLFCSVRLAESHRFGEDGNEILSNLAYIVFALISTGICVCYYLRYYKLGYKYPFIVMFLLTALVLPWLNYGDAYDQYMRFIAPVTLLLILGTVLGNRLIRYTGYFYLAITITLKAESLPYWVSVVFFVGAMATMIWWVLRHYSLTDKLLLTALTVIGLIAADGNGFISSAVAYMATAIVCMAASMKWYNTNPCTKQTEVLTRRLVYLMTFIVLYTGILMLCADTTDNVILFGYTLEGTKSVSLMIMIMAVIGVALINNRRLYSEPLPQTLTSIYLATKYLILLVVILNRLHALGFMISIAGIMLALAYIIVGFRYELKPMRIYGLILSILCVGKLALTDIEYSSALMKPVGYLVAGALCYAISWSYSRLERKK